MTMEIEVEESGPGLRWLGLDGRLDMKGALLIDTRFTALTAPFAGTVIVDLARVDFIASIGMRLLLSNAKAMANRGGRMLLCGGSETLRDALSSAGIDVLIPLCADREAALALAGQEG